MNTDDRSSTKYLDYVLRRIENLLSEEREFYTIDLHIHTKYSLDGQDELMDKLKRCKKNKFDMISITDHDSISIYQEVIHRYQSGELDRYPIIVPGIEFSLKYEGYSGLCHILKYFIDINDSVLCDEVKRNRESYWKRAMIQCQRIESNPILKYYMCKYGIQFSFHDFKEYLEQNKIELPEYMPLIEYIYQKLSKVGVTIADIYSMAVKTNHEDICVERKEKRAVLLNRFYDRHGTELYKDDVKLLLPLLAPVGIDDDDYITYPSTGSLSVNEYGQIPLMKLKSKGVTVVAHPTLDVDMIIKHCTDIMGLELNKCNWRTKEEAILNKRRNYDLFYTIGSDSHSVNDDLYSDISYYQYSHDELSCLYRRAKKYLDERKKEHEY